MRVVATGIEQLTNTLSGGNQQKVLLAKWLIPAPRVLILDQPTRGIDVGAKAEIHRIISQLATQGIAIILIGDDAAEVIAMADRILVFRSGRVVAEFARDSVDQEAMMLAAAHTSHEPRGRRPCGPAMSELARDRTGTLARRGARLVGRSLRVREFGLVLALLLVCASLVTLREPRFLGAANLEQVALSATLVCIVALGEALVIITRQIDLSVGAIVAMSAFVAADWLEDHQQGSMVIVFLIGLGVGGALGLFNALLVAVARIPAIVATLGTLAIYRGGVIVLAAAARSRRRCCPTATRSSPGSTSPGVPLLVWLAILLTLLFGWWRRYTRTGRNLYALGSSPESARLRRHQRDRAYRLRVHPVGPVVRPGRRALGRAVRHGRCRARAGSASPGDLGGGDRRGQHLRRQRLGLRRRDRCGDLRRAAERRAAARDQPVLARGGDRRGDPRHRDVLQPARARRRARRAARAAMPPAADR